MPPKCYNCGEMGHVARECPAADLGPRCYNCGEHGHTAQNCQAVDPIVFNPVELTNAAHAAGFVERQPHNSTEKVLYFENPHAKVDVYYTTRVIKTVLDHPQQGTNQLFRQQSYSSLESFVSLLKNPRLHTDMGYRRSADATLACTKCGVVKSKEDFTKNQWAKRKDGARCMACADSQSYEPRDEDDAPKNAGKKSNRKPRPPKCYNCGEIGHISRECPAADLGPKCYNCGEHGHLSQDCSA